VKPKAIVFIMIFLLSMMGNSPVFSQSQLPNEKVITYYFYGGVRCSSCILIEKYTGDAIKKWFSDEISAGLVEYKPVDLEKSGNEHFVKDFRLFSKAVVVVDTRDGKTVQWKNLDRVWTLLHDSDVFGQYIRDEVAVYLKSK